MIEVPGRGPLEITTVILDLNGTITIDGNLIDGVAERVERLKNEGLDFRLFSGDTLGNAGIIAKQLGIQLHTASNGQAKADEAKKLPSPHIAAIGNGCIDSKLFESARLRISVLQSEGLFAPLLAQTDILVPSITDALDLLIHKSRLIATLRA